MVDFEKNTPLVYYIYDKYYKNEKRYKEDIIQCGMLGLWKACKRFSERNNCRFSTFASICIRNEMGMFMRKQRKFDNHVVDCITESADGGEVDFLDFVKDESTCPVDEKAHIDNCINRTKVIKELLKCKTIKQIAKEQHKSIGYICDTIAREKMYLEQIM